jgi:hypothetical protein
MKYILTAEPLFLREWIHALPLSAVFSGRFNEQGFRSRQARIGGRLIHEDQLLEREALLEEIVDVVCPLLLAPGTRNHVQLLASQSQPADQRKGGRHSYDLAKGVVDEGDELIKEEIPVFGLAVCPFYPSLYPLQLLDGPVMIAPSALGLLECPVRVPARDPSLQCAARENAWRRWYWRWRDKPPPPWR